MCLSEAELEAAANAEDMQGLPTRLRAVDERHEDGLFQRKKVDWPKPVYKPPKLKVPKAFYKFVEQPNLPPLPTRFQHNLFYEDTPLETGLTSHLEGTEALDAMLGTSDRLQSAARSVLRAEKFAAGIVKAREDVEAKKRAKWEAQLRAEEEARRAAEAAREETTTNRRRRPNMS